MRTLVENVKFEKGKWYLLRPDVPYHLWVAFTPKRTVKFDTVLKDMCKLRDDTVYLPETAFNIVLTSKGTTRYTGTLQCAPLPDGTAVESSYIIHYNKSADGKGNTTAYAERVSPTMRKRATYDVLCVYKTQKFVENIY